MDPQFLKFYNSELQYIREMGSEFAREFPKIAGRLGLETFECADPYVERLLEGFAFLSARVQLKLDGEYPRFTQHLLEMTYPHYLCPTPSMTVVEMKPDLTEGALADGYVVPRQTSLRSVLGKGDQTACEYRTGHDTTLWPLELVQADYFSRDVSNISLPPKLQKAKAGVRLRLRATAGLTFDKLALDRLPIFVRGGEQRAMRLYEQIFAACDSVVVRPVGNAWQEILPKSSIRRVGFSDEESLLPIVPESFQGYRLLQEYFAFFQRFMFFELTGLAPAVRRCKESMLEIIVLFNRAESMLENVVDVSNFGLFCTPAVNLFPHRADRIHLNRHDHEYQVVPDRTRPMDLEVFRINNATGYSEDDPKPTRFRSFYSMSDTALEPAQSQTAYYTQRRVPRPLSSKQKRAGPRTSYIGSEVYLSLVDGRQAPHGHGLNQLDLNILCTNRDLPLTMSVGKGTTDFTLEIGAPVKSVRCVAGPTEPVPAHDFSSGAHIWRLVNHLSLNYLSLLGDEKQGGGATALRELLKLYADIYEPDQAKQVEGLQGVASKPITRRLPLPGPMTFGRGLEITLTCEESAYAGAGVFLLGAVMAEFFSKYVSINSFTETILRTVERGEIMRWPASIGRKHLI